MWYWNKRLLHAITTYWDRKHWSQDLLAPLSLLFNTLVFLRRKAYSAGLLKRYDVAIPIIVIGNIRVGGSGKTPVLISLVQWLQSLGLKVGVVSRGFGRITKTSLLVTHERSAEVVGDEPLLIFKETGAPVAVAKRRFEAVHLLTQAYPLDIIVSDDGLQHYAMARSLEICIQEPLECIQNRYTLPVGPWREPLSRLQYFDCVWEWSKAVQVVPKGFLEQVGGSDLQLPLQQFSGTEVHAVAGIARPERFFELLRSFNIKVIPHIFPDHHRFCVEDFCFNPTLPVLMTAKDAIKCQAFAKVDWWSVPVKAVIHQDTLKALEEKVRWIRNC